MGPLKEGRIVLAEKARTPSHLVLTLIDLLFARERRIDYNVLLVVLSIT